MCSESVERASGTNKLIPDWRVSYPHARPSYHHTRIAGGRAVIDNTAAFITLNISVIIISIAHNRYNIYYIFSIIKLWDESVLNPACPDVHRANPIIIRAVTTM